MSQYPVSMSYSRPGPREACLLLVGAAFTSLMFDQSRLAVACGALALLVWVVTFVRGPRLTWKATLVAGAGLVVTYMWWPAEGWWPAAISLMWAGVALVAYALLLGYRERQRGKNHNP